MRLSALLIPLSAFVAAAVLALVGAGFAAGVVEDASEIGVRDQLDARGFETVEVEANGLQVILTGTAETEADRFAALTAAGRVVDAARVIDRMEIAPTQGIDAPVFSIEMLRNDSGISLIGLLPAATDRAAMLDKLDGADGLSDFLETADYPVPEGWNDTLDFALYALDLLPRSKISMQAERVAVTAIADSAEQKARWETDLARRVPDAVQLALSISAPRPVITPFTLRFVIDGDGARFDACSAHTDAGRTEILSAAAKAGLAGKAECTLGLGVPSPKWSAAVATSIAALAELGAGTLTFSDADISLIATEGTAQGHFDRVMGDLEADLPDIFSLRAVLPEPPAETPEGPPEFTATLSPEGQIQLRGRLRDDMARTTTDSFAKAQFGADAVYMATRLDESLPQGWALRVLAGLEAFSELENGFLRVTPDTVSLRGDTGNADASAQIARLLSDKLGQGSGFDIDVTYREALDPIAALPTPEECIAKIKAITDETKITFEPGSATIDAAARPALDALAELLRECGEIRIEISGHTDSQGRETMNQQLSQQRAESVLNELRMRRVLTSTFSAVGYGEEQPIADNDTEAGRDANRRIEFRLIRPEPGADTQTTLESDEQSGETDGAPGDSTQDAGGQGTNADEPD